MGFNKPSESGEKKLVSGGKLANATERRGSDLDSSAGVGFCPSSEM